MDCLTCLPMGLGLVLNSAINIPCVLPLHGCYAVGKTLLLSREDAEPEHVCSHESVCAVLFLSLRLKIKGELLSKYKELDPGSERMFAVL